MPKIKKADISLDMLIADGWVKIEGDRVFLAEKKLPNRNPLNSSEDTDLKLVIHGMYNQWTFALVLGDGGGMLSFVANSMKELHGFENVINFYDPPF